MDGDALYFEVVDFFFGLKRLSYFSFQVLQKINLVEALRGKPRCFYKV